MSVFKPLVAVAALTLIVTACSKEETTVIEETPAAAPAPSAPDTSSMSGSAPTTVNPTPEGAAPAAPPATPMETTPPAK